MLGILPSCVMEAIMNKGEVKHIAAEVAANEVHEHEQHMHHGVVPTKLSPHITVVSHADGRHVVHNDHTGHSETHHSAAKARAVARDMRKG